MFSHLDLLLWSKVFVQQLFGITKHINDFSVQTNQQKMLYGHFQDCNQTQENKSLFIKCFLENIFRWNKRSIYFTFSGYVLFCYSSCLSSHISLLLIDHILLKYVEKLNHNGLGDQILKKKKKSQLETDISIIWNYTINLIFFFSN